MCGDLDYPIAKSIAFDYSVGVLPTLAAEVLTIIISPSPLS